MAAHKRPLDATVAPEQEAARSPRKRLRRAVFTVMFLRSDRSRAREGAVTAEQMAQMVRQVLVPWLGSVEERLFLELPGMLRGILADKFCAFPRSFVGSKEGPVRSVLQAQMKEPHGGYEPSSSRFSVGSIEGTVRSVLQTEMQQPQAASLPNGVYEPSSSRVISEGLPETGGSSGAVKLRFVDADRPEDTVFTHCPVNWLNGKNTKVAIFQNEKQIMGGDLSKLQIEILPVYADFFTERGHEDFTQEEFNKQIHLFKGKESVLTTVNLRDGQADLGSIIFTESSHRKDLRLAARVKRQDLTVRVQEAISHPFVVKDRRSELNAKSKLPSKGDAVHTLKGISKNGKHFTALKGKNITTVKDLLRQYHIDKSSLQKITGMKGKSWSTMIEHARTCAPGDEIYSYGVAEENCEVLFNDLYDLVGIIINGLYVPVRNIDKDQQRKVKNWKISAHKNFEEQENSGTLAPVYFMSNDDRPVREKPLNNEAGPSVQARPPWQYPNDMGTLQEFGEQHPFRQQNGFSPAEVLSNNGAGSSKQKAQLCSQKTAHQDLGQHGPSMLDNGTPYYLTRGNILNGQGPFSGQPTIPSHNFLPVPKDVSIIGSGPVDQHNGNFSSLMSDAPRTSLPVTGVENVSDGLNQGTSSINYVEDDFFSGLSPIQNLFESEQRMADQGFVGFLISAEVPNSNNQFDGYENDGGNQ